MKRNLFLASILTGLCVILSLLTLSLSGCSSVAKALNIENPRYSFRNIRPNVSLALPLSASTIDLDFTLAVDNPNSVGLRLDRVDFDLLINDNPVLNSVSRDPRIQIPARGVGDVRLTTRLDYQSLRNLASSVFADVQGNRAKYALRGSAYYDTPVGTLKFPVTVFSTNTR
jgi:LEA14-like dessication related protein